MSKLHSIKYIIPDFCIICITSSSNTLYFLHLFLFLRFYCESKRGKVALSFIFVEIRSKLRGFLIIINLFLRTWWWFTVCIIWDLQRWFFIFLFLFLCFILINLNIIFRIFLILNIFKKSWIFNNFFIS
jgi:hypothetical protein